MTEIQATTTKRFTKHFKRYANAVNQRDSAVIVARKNRPNVVLISAATYDAWQQSRQAMALPQHDSLQESIDQLTNRAVVPQPPEIVDEESPTNLE